MRDGLVNKKTRLLTLVTFYEKERKQCLQQGKAFRPPSRDQLLREASVGKNYLGQTDDQELKKRVSELLKTKIKSKSEQQAQKAVKKSETMEEVVKAAIKSRDHLSHELASLRRLLLEKEKTIIRLTSQVKSASTTIGTLRGLISEEPVNGEVTKTLDDDVCRVVSFTVIDDSDNN
ncbi:hypothetical protein [Thalassospira alkalitolerans]|uniref:hypothetical protein n=1 Tax=Thalassospira alkalitolerans TaxID=1293890 RepID=UPI003AA9249E